MPGGRTTAQGGRRAQCSMVERMGLENGSPDCFRVVSLDTSRSCDYRRVRGEVGTRGTR